MQSRRSPRLSLGLLGLLLTAALPDAVTLPQRFRDGGYYTAGAGKIFHHYQNDAESWDAYFPSVQYEFPPGSFSPPGYDSGYGDWQGRYTQFCWQQLDQRDERSADYQNVAYVIGQLEALPTDRPFFLNCGIYRPHVPWFAPRKYFEPFPLDEVQLPASRADDRDDLPPSAVQWLNRGRYYAALEETGKHREAVQGYLASVHYMDAMVGVLLDALDASPHADNTIVVFWSDHGFHLGEKQWYRKYTLWDDACHVPLIIRLPTTMRAGSAQPGVCEKSVSLLDLYPTLCELAGVESGAEPDGNSLVPLLHGDDTPGGRAAVTVNDWNTAYAVRSDGWCYIQRVDGEELYAPDDPHQFDNLADDPQHAGRIARLRSYIPAQPAAVRRAEQKP
ncbi:sulfatase-like hydrolase/transferase [Phycisphaeraceae bacterium D3-23]